MGGHNMTYIMKSFLAVLLVVTLAAPAAFVTSGCSGSTKREVDVSAGNYYGEDELAEMSDRKKNKYCEALGAELTRTQEEFESKTEQLRDTRDTIDAKRLKMDPVERDVLRLESDIRTLNDLIDEVKALPSTWTIKEGESMSLIASFPEVYNDVEKWWRIFEANHDRVDDPFYVFPDTVLVIPRDWPTD
jgi:nucleoid-associated protein YgaU